jgi:hypothetical protein
VADHAAGACFPKAGRRHGCTARADRGYRCSRWAHEATDTRKTVVDMALAHAVADKTEAAYRRGDLFTKRRKLMTTWASYAAGPVQATGDVVSLRERSSV